MFGFPIQLSDYAKSDMALVAWKVAREHNRETPQHQSDAIAYAAKCPGWSYPKDPEWT